jgi:protein subunit release factor A
MFVRITHTPTGIAAECGEARSRFLNKQIALGMIEYALVELEYL